MPRLKIEDDELLCPTCGNRNLHQTSVSIFSRYEDGPSQRVDVTHDDFFFRAEPKVLIWGDDRNPSEKEHDANPSPRRQGLRVRFDCEHCREEKWMIIFQHKGSTIVEWELT